MKATNTPIYSHHCQCKSRAHNSTDWKPNQNGVTNYPQVLIMRNYHVPLHSTNSTPLALLQKTNHAYKDFFRNFVSKSGEVVKQIKNSQPHLLDLHLHPQSLCYPHSGWLGHHPLLCNPYSLQQQQNAYPTITTT